MSAAPEPGDAAAGACPTDGQFQQYLEAGTDSVPGAFEGFLAHLEGCDGCQERLQGFQSLDPAYEALIAHGRQPAVAGPEAGRRSLR
jgi:hypothetical protein